MNNVKISTRIYFNDDHGFNVAADWCIFPDKDGTYPAGIYPENLRS